MRKIIVTVLILLLIIIVSSFSNFNLTGAAVADLADSGSIDVFFCPKDDCGVILVNFLDSAKESIHCALYEISLPDVQKKLLEKSKNIEVQIVTDDHYLDRFNYHFVKEDKWGHMHDKFCIIDGKKISTGSMNPTVNGVNKNNNNLLLIESTILAKNYEEEFQELWNGIFKEGEQTRNREFTINGIEIKNYFCPEDFCADKIKKELMKANKSIHLMIFSFTEEGIANILLLKQLEGVKIDGIMEAKQISKYSQFERLKYNGIEVVKDVNKQNMHHKVFIIDEETVITGSFNPSTNADTGNDENVLIIKDKEIAGKFMEEFDQIT